MVRHNAMRHFSPTQANSKTIIVGSSVLVCRPTSTLPSHSPSVNFSQLPPCIFQFSGKCAIKDMEIKSTTNNWAIRSWKLHPPWWKCFERNKWCFIRRLLQKLSMKRTIAAVNRKNWRWRKKTLQSIDFLWYKPQKVLKQKEENGMNEQKIVVKAIFMGWKTFYTPWMQFSWHVRPFHRGENAFMNYCLYMWWDKCSIHKDIISTEFCLYCQYHVSAKMAFLKGL